MTKALEYLLVGLFVIAILLAALTYLSPEVSEIIKSIWLAIKAKINGIIGINPTITMDYVQKYLG